MPPCLSSFLPGTTRQGRALWRLDNPERHRLDLYLVSPVPPSLEAIVDQAGWPSQPVWRTTEYNRFLNKLESGQLWMFRLRANPIKSIRPEGGGRGQRVPLARVDEQVTWLTSRSEAHGFTLAQGEHGPNLRVTERRTERFRRGGPGGSSVTLATAAFEGVLEVVDPGRLRESLTTGIGTAKGYGCGLMTLAKPR